ncbi:hypothetical protein IQ243_01235 [Nostocales cyanobacterium LEGE 11386]|nr:hypothetical protein [Nostocales cyanobacterium LEGE 11386]
MEQKIYCHCFHCVAGIILLGVSYGCTMPQPNQVTQSNSVTTTPTSIQTNNSQSNKPDTKTATISIEGEDTPITLRFYKQYSSVFTTYYPDAEFLSQGVSSGEGTGVKFIANFDGSKNEDAYVNLSFLNSFNSLEQLRSFVNGESGPIVSNGWQVVSRTQKTPYPWAQEQIVFRKGQDITGVVYLGQQNGKVFYTVTHYPVEYGDGFSPRADLILKNLQVGG